MPGNQIAPVLKSNAYGHGLFEVARILEHSDHNIPFFVVDSYFEAVALRAEGFQTPLVIMGYTRPSIIAHSSLKNTAFTITSMEVLRRFSAEKPQAPEGYDEEVHGKYHIPHSHRIRIHLKIDTGMRRQGILPDEINEAESIIKGNECLVLEGICTHFCDSDDPDESFTEGQIGLWNRIVKQFRSSFPHLKYTHASATDGLRFSEDIEANVGRLGIGLYGLSDNAALGARLKLQPVLSMKTILTGVKHLKAGETIGYGNTYEAVGDMVISTIPVGYFEGLDRRMSSNGFVQVGTDNVPCEILGRVSMNISSIDVTKVKDPIIGTSVTVISYKADDSNSIQTIAKLCGTIPYEVAVKIPAHLKRVVVD